MLETWGGQIWNQIKIENFKDLRIKRENKNCFDALLLSSCQPNREKEKLGEFRFLASKEKTQIWIFLSDPSLIIGNACH